MLQSIFIPFFTLLAAEMLDKSQLSLLILSTKTKHRLQLFLGSILAFAIVDGLAVVLGAWITSILPQDTIKLIAGIAFIVFGVLLFRKDGKEKKQNLSVRNAFISAFTVIMLTEWGDKTQLATAVFATQYNAFLVFLGVMMALALLSLLAIYLGHWLAKRIDPSLVHRIAAILFLFLGISFLIFR